MDPYSRRFTWDIIRKHRQNCAIVLTTHFLDEADLLCDRIAIMSAGKLACIGSSVFLKNRFGAGYHLVLVRDSEVTDNSCAIANLIKTFVPAAVKSSDIGSELSFQLPTDSAKMFAPLISALDEKK